MSCTERWMCRRASGRMDCSPRFSELRTKSRPTRTKKNFGGSFFCDLGGEHELEDDNRLLTLINGDRIRFCKMLYEVYDLQYASPATISRCGMVYVDPKDLGDKPYFERWISKFGGEKKEQNEVLIESFD